MALAMQHLYRLVANGAGAAKNNITCEMLCCVSVELAGTS